MKLNVVEQVGIASNSEYFKVNEFLFESMGGKSNGGLCNLLNRWGDPDI